MSLLGYSNEKLWKAVGILATHPGAVKERLIRACEEGLVFVAQDSLPVHLQSDYKAMWAKVTAVEPVDVEGRFRPSIGQPRAFFMMLWRPCSRNDGRSCGIRWG